jgi:hypothetical protein
MRGAQFARSLYLLLMPRFSNVVFTKISNLVKNERNALAALEKKIPRISQIL